MIFIWENNILKYIKNKFGYYISIDESERIVIDGDNVKCFSYRLFISENLKYEMYADSEDGDFLEMSQSSEYVSHFINEPNEFSNFEDAKVAAEKLIKCFGWKIIEQEMMAFT
jgi:hypothetical protein